MARCRFMVRSVTSIGVSARLDFVFGLPGQRCLILPQQNMLNFSHQHSLVAFPSSSSPSG